MGTHVGEAERMTVYNLFPWNKCQRNLYLRCRAVGNHTVLRNVTRAWVNIFHSVLAFSFLRRCGSVFRWLAIVERKISNKFSSWARSHIVALVAKPLLRCCFSVVICIKKVFGSRRRKMHFNGTENSTGEQIAEQRQTFKSAKQWEKRLGSASRYISWHLNEAHQSFNRFSLLLLSFSCKVNFAPMELNENGFSGSRNEIATMKIVRRRRINLLILTGLWHILRIHSYLSSDESSIRIRNGAFNDLSHSALRQKTLSRQSSLEYSLPRRRQTVRSFRFWRISALLIGWWQWWVKSDDNCQIRIGPINSTSNAYEYSVRDSNRERFELPIDTVDTISFQ